MHSDQTTSNQPDGANGERGPYIRGGAGRPVEGRRLLRRLGIAVLAGLTGLALILTVDAARAAIRTHRLRADGVEVSVTVTSCLGIASGTGMTPVGFTCRGAFTLNGHRYTDVINGTSVLRHRGQLLVAITDPQDPSVLATVPAVESAPSATQRLMLPAALWLVLAAVLTIAFRLRRPGAGVIVDG